MSKLYKFFTPAFTPFFSTSKKVYTLICAIWLVVFGALWINAPSLIPGPMQVLDQLIGFLTDTSFYYDVLASLELTIKAMLFSIIIASILAYSSVIAAFRPVITMIVKFRFMSLLGFLFVFMLMFNGNSNNVKLFLLMFSIIPFFVLSLLTTIQRISQKEFDLWTTLRYSKWEQLYEIIIYGKADYIIEAIGVNFAMGWVMMTFAESICMADGGLGVLLFKYNKYNQLDKIFALQIIILSLGMLFDFLLKQLRYKLFPYTALAEKK